MPLATSIRSTSYSAPPMRFMYQYPETTGSALDMLDSGPVADLARAAEAAGWSGFAFTEHPAGGARWLEASGHQTLDPFVALGHVAAVTARLRLFTYLSVAAYRNPLLLAKAATTVDRLSDGRFTLGLGAGYLKTEFFALGVDFDERNALFDETLDVLPLCWSGKPFSYHGRHFDARDVVTLPRPAQDPIPIWIGGNSSVTLDRVAERAQGWMPLTSHADISKTTRTPRIGSNDDLAAMIRDLRTRAGDRATALDISVGYTDPTISEPSKDVDRHRDALAALEAIGATWVVVTPRPRPYPETRAFIDAFAAHYISG